jgi:hypothetical protein
MNQMMWFLYGRAHDVRDRRHFTASAGLCGLSESALVAAATGHLHELRWLAGPEVGPAGGEAALQNAAG